MKVLIVNADDFGHSEPVNDGIVRAHEFGIVTSASLMVNRDAGCAPADYARSHATLGVGLHVDLGEWHYRRGFGWVTQYEVEGMQIEAEVERQLAQFRALVNRWPTHLDSHQHVHLREPARSIVIAAGRELGVPVRHFDERVRYCGDFYGQTETGEPLPEAVTPRALMRLVRAVQPGITELACHPGTSSLGDTPYASERARELEALCDPRVRAAIEDAGVTLQSFDDLWVAVGRTTQQGDRRGGPRSASQ